MSRIWLWSLCGFIVAIELALGTYMTIGQGIIYPDALSRLANAFYVLHSRDPHLAAIGFVWNPLPSLLSLPLLMLYPFVPSFASSGMFIVILTALFAGLTVLIVWQGFRRFAVPLNAATVGVGLLFALHPFQLWYGANGMSEVIFGFFLAVAIVYWTFWLKSDSVKDLLFTAAALALAFLTRYEAVPFAALLIFCTLMIMIDRRASRSKLESVLLVMSLPIFFTGCVWIWLNYTIMDNPLYFLNSAYSNQEQSSFLADNDQIGRVIGDPVQSLLYMLQRTSFFLLPYIAILVTRHRRTGTLRHADLLALTLLVWSIPLFQWFMLINGSSYGWLRFFYYPLLIVFAWLPYEWAITPTPALRRVKGLSIAAFALSAVIVVAAMINPSLAPEEYAAIHHEESEMFISAVMEKQIAQQLDETIFEKDAEALILTDSFNANRIIINSKHPDRFINSTDRDFKAILADPFSFDVLYFLVPLPGGLSDLNAVYTAYPGFYDGRYDWARLDRMLDDGWKLFRIVRPAG